MALFKGWEKKLSTKGGTITGDLFIGNGNGYIGADNATMQVTHYVNNNDYTVLFVSNTKNLSDRIQFLTRKDNVTNAYNLYGSHNIVPITNGGTGGTNRKDGMFNLSFLGANLIANTSADTITTWQNLGTGYTFFSSNVMNNQPGRYMIVLNIAYGSDIMQIGKVQAGGSLYYRGGNASGWAQNWTEIASSAGLGSYATKSYVDNKLSASAIQSLLTGGSVSVIKNIQRGIITIAANQTVGTATISSVNTGKSVVLYGGSIIGGGDYYSSYWDARLVLTNGTTVTATRAYAPSYNATVPYQVIQFN